MNGVEYHAKPVVLVDGENKMWEKKGISMMNLSLSFNVTPDSSLPSDEFTKIIARKHTILIPRIEKKRMLCAQVLGQCALAINHDGTWVVLWIILWYH